MDAEADRGARTAASAVAESTIPRRARPRRSFSLARASRLWTRPGRAAEPPGGLVEREALEVAEHDRQPERRGQAVDLVVQGLGLLAIEQPPDRPAERSGTPRGDARRGPPRSGGAGRAGRGPCGPCGPPRRRASCPAGRDRGSTGPSAPGRGRRPGRRPRRAGGRPGAGGRRPGPSARAAPRARRRRPRRRRIAAGDEPLDELAIGEPGDRAALEERLELPGHRRRRRVSPWPSILPPGSLGSSFIPSPVLPAAGRLVRDSSSKIAGMTAHPVRIAGSVIRRLLDQDIAQVERLAGLDGEVLADLVAPFVVDGREVGDPVQGAGDQREQGDAALGVGARAVPVVLAVDVGEEVGVGRQLGLVLRVRLDACSGRAWRRISKSAGRFWRRAGRRARRTAPWPGRRAATGSSAPRRPACRRPRPSRPTRARHRGCEIRVEPSGSRPCSSKRPSRILTGMSPPPVRADTARAERGEDMPSVTVWPSGPSTRPLIVTPGRSAAATSSGGSPALTS